MPKINKLLASVPLSLTLLCSSSTNGADAAASAPAQAASHVVDCTKPPSVPTDASEAVKTAFSSITEICAQLQLRDAKAQLDQSKTAALAQALSSFSSIQGPSGVINNPDNAAHVGEWIAQRLAYKAGTRIGVSIPKQEIPAGTPLVVTIDQSPAESRAKLRVALDTLTRLRTALIAATTGASQARSPSAPSETDREAATGRSAAALLALVPPTIDAAKSIASLFRTETTVSAIAVSAKANAIAAGVARCVDSTITGNVVTPGLVAIRNTNKFEKAHAEATQAADTARAMLASVSSDLEKAKADGATNLVKSLTRASQTLETGLKAFDAYEATLASNAESLFLAAEIYGDDNAVYIYVTNLAFGASGGTVKRTFGSDQFQYRATLELVYQVILPNGKVVKAGEVPLTAFAQFTASDFTQTLKAEPDETSCARSTN
jgi:hypothetical protein